MAIASMVSTRSPVNVILDTMDSCVRHKLMNANRIRANLVDIVKISLAVINAVVSLEHRAAIVNITSMNVSAIHAGMVPLVSMGSIDIHAIVFQDSPANIAKQTSTNVPAIHVLTEVIFKTNYFLLNCFLNFLNYDRQVYRLGQRFQMRLSSWLF